MGQRGILLGDEAVAHGAVDAGISGAYSYPGTPATEILEAVQAIARCGGPAVHARWSANEKVALEEAAGMSYAGARSLVSFKHVGLNVAADPFVNLAVSGAHGGLVVAVADDPSMHSSQNEQDSRHYADFAQIPCLEPADPQHAYDLTREAFDVSERFCIPVLLRLVTRLAHSRAIVTTGDRRAQNAPRWTDDPSPFTLLPSNARKAYAALLEKQPALARWSEDHPGNVLEIRGDGRPGIVVAGSAAGYVREALGARLSGYNVLWIAAYPIPSGKVRALAEKSGEVRVVENGYPFAEQRIAALSKVPVLGRLTGMLPRAGELNPDLVKKAFDVPPCKSLHVHEAELLPVARPPQLCEACPHIDTFEALKEALRDHPDARVMGDIGCYTLGYYPPHRAIDSCLCMGAGISMAIGARHAGKRPVVGVIGDSTFTHSGMTPLLDAARENTDVKVIILDNGIVAMTGGQPTMAAGEELSNIVAGLGVRRERIRVIVPLPKNRDENVRVLREELAAEGLSVVIASRACVTYARAIKEQRRASAEGDS